MQFGLPLLYIMDNELIELAGRLEPNIGREKKNGGRKVILHSREDCASDNSHF